MFLEIATHAAVTASFEAFERRNQLAAMWAKVAYRIKHGKLKIAVLGPGGVGKSTLGRFLQNPSEKMTPKPYDESFHIEPFALPGGIVAELLTSPGQELRRENGWDDVFEKLEAASEFGVIHVVANGFHSTTLALRDVRLQNESTNVAQARYFGECRIKEQESVKEIEVRLRKIPKKFWMITLATKQDLWWKDRANVVQHYTQSEYNETIKRLTANHRASGFQHEYFSVSLHAQNLVGLDGTHIVETAAGYDDVIKYGHQARLLELLYGFVSIKD